VAEADYAMLYVDVHSVRHQFPYDRRNEEGALITQFINQKSKLTVYRMRWIHTG